MRLRTKEDRRRLGRWARFWRQDTISCTVRFSIVEYGLQRFADDVEDERIPRGTSALELQRPYWRCSMQATALEMLGRACCLIGSACSPPFISKAPAFSDVTVQADSELTAPRSTKAEKSGGRYWVEAVGQEQ
jgi:hypothetical protein